MQIRDVFLSHANEDKEAFVRPLAKKLESMGISVWFDEYCISYGDSISNSINLGLEKSHLGIVVLSKAFFEKRWTLLEFGALNYKRGANRQCLIPLYYKINSEEVAKKIPFLADIMAINCPDDSIVNHVATEISLKVNEIRSKYHNLYDLDLPSISKLLLGKKNRHCSLLASHIEKFSSLEEIDRDMAIIRARIMLESMLKQASKEYAVCTDPLSFIESSPVFNKNIREHLKMIFSVSPLGWVKPLAF